MNDLDKIIEAFRIEHALLHELERRRLRVLQWIPYPTFVVAFVLGWLAHYAWEYFYG